MRTPDQRSTVGVQPAVGGLAHIAGLGVEAEATAPIASDPGGLHVGVAGGDRCQRLGDSTGDELVVARRLWALAALQV